MKLSTTYKRYIVETTCLLYSLLFSYASVSKLIDFDNFQIQLGQSPLLSAFATWVSWIIPVSEIIIALLLFIPKLRFQSLFLAYSLMVMFTAYIYILLHYSSFVPCSCGGILEKLSWNQHLFFNLLFVILGVFSILSYDVKVNFLNNKLK